MKTYWVYILCSQQNGTLYVGMTSNLSRRMYEHKQNIIKGFTKKYGTNRLVHVEQFDDVYAACSRERSIKKWNRLDKLKLIEQTNPQWNDLCKEIQIF